jgi:hypothetical protein
MGLSLKNIAKAAVATAAVSAATKVLSGASPANQVMSGIASAGDALNNIGKNLNNLANNGLGIPGVANPGGTGALSGENAVDYTSGNVLGTVNTNAETGNKTQINQDPPLPNELHDYASYNYIWTLSALSRSHLNFPDDSYRKGILGPIILKSGSGEPDDRIGLTEFTSTANPQGKYDYFIENVRIKGVTGLDKMTGNTNSTGINFTVIEPYSIGLFFQSLQVAASKVKYKNWVEMPVLLRLEFFGHKDFGSQNVKSIRTKYFPLKIANIQMRVTDKGSVYDCTAIPWNERAHSKQIGQIKSDIKCSGRTVQEMLQKSTKDTVSFQSILNDQLASQALAMSQGKNEEIVADRVLILFPLTLETGYTGGAKHGDVSRPEGATTQSNQSSSSNNQGVAERLGVELEGINYVQNSNISPIGLADMGFIDQKKAEENFSKDNAVWDPEKKVYVRGELYAVDKAGIATFMQGQSISNVINQVILSSDYGRQALQQIDNDGYVNWWRIDTQMYMLEGEGNMTQTGRYPFLTVYRVIPHKVHHSRFVQTDQPAQSAQIKRTAVKEYNYIYTSKNLDILDFQINFNASFYTALSADSNKYNKDINNRSQMAADATKSTPIVKNGKLSSLRKDANGNEYDASQEYASGKHGNMRVDDPMSNIVQIRNAEIDIGSSQGGTTGEDPGRLAARQFHRAINNVTDMVQLQMKILGDPFYIGDSGMGNYTAGESNIRGVNSDLAIHYQRGEVYINVNFQNPIDINYKRGDYDFPKGEYAPSFSGLYKVGQVESTFDRGIFTQTLDLTRMPNQTKEGAPSKKPDTAGTDLIDEFVPGQAWDGILYNDDDAGEWT